MWFGVSPDSCGCRTGLDWMGRLHQFQSAQVAIPVTIKEILLTEETNLKFYGLLRGCQSNF